MKSSYCGLVLLCLFVGSMAMPTKMEATEATTTAKETKSGMGLPMTENKTVAEAEALIESFKKAAVENKDQMNSSKTEEPKIEGKSAGNVNQDKDIKAAEEVTKKESDKVKKDMENKKNAEDTENQSGSWNDDNDSFWSLQHRYPDLTHEEFHEINHEDAIPLNFLKGFALNGEEGKEVNKDGEKINDLAKIAPELFLQPENPIYLTIPIVINSHSTLPISLSIGGNKIPLDANGKEITPPLIKKLSYAAAPPRETNRHRSNLRTKIYARNKRHEVQQFARPL